MHEISRIEQLQGWTFTHCWCGWTIAEVPSGEVYWLKAKKPALLLPDGDLDEALHSKCHVWDRQRPEKREKHHATLERRRLKAAPTAPVIEPAPTPVVVRKVVRKRKAAK